MVTRGDALENWHLCTYFTELSIKAQEIPKCQINNSEWV